MEASSYQLSATFLATLPLWRVKGGAEKSQPSNHGLVFGDQPPSRSQPRISSEQKMSLVFSPLRKSQEFMSSGAKTNMFSLISLLASQPKSGNTGRVCLACLM